MPSTQPTPGGASREAGAAPVADPAGSPPSPKAFAGRLVLICAYLVPVGYVALIVSVAIHELLGHGAVAWLLGGSFDGFALMPDGMGWAMAYATEWDVCVLAGGVTVGTFIGLAVLILGLWQRHVIPRITLFLFAFLALWDATPYVFWNSVFPRPPGDIGRILLEAHSETLRWCIVTVSGAAYLATTVGGNCLLFRCVESLAGPLTRARAYLVAFGLFGVLGAAAWFTFDWNQAIENVGRLPQFVGAGLQLAMAPILVSLRRPLLQSTQVTAPVWGLAIGSAWAVSVVLVVSLVLWFRHGVQWG